MIEEFYKQFLAQRQQFTTDTRKLKPGDVFFALKGDNFNGNLYAKKALDDGAALVVGDEDIDFDSPQVIHVNNVLTFMQELATHHRSQFNVPILAIAGSNGKTTTKELLISVLSRKYKTHATQGNFNNHIGVPITLLSMPLDTEVGLIEIGTNSFGEIAFLCALLQPNYGIITNIGKEHLEGFGDLEGVAREESELFHYLLKNQGFAFVNLDDVYLSRMSHRLPKKRTYSIQSDRADTVARPSQVAPGLIIPFQDKTLRSKLGGLHNAQNIAATVAIAVELEVSLHDIEQGIESYQPNNNRSEIKTIGTNNFLLDAYNANPSSMEAAIETFEQLDAKNKVILLGDMFELGDTSAKEHTLIAERLSSLEGYEIYVAGKQFCAASSPLHLNCFETTSELVDFLKEKDYSNTWFLVKGSRGMKMEQVLDAFN